MSKSYRAWLPRNFESAKQALKHRDKLVAALKNGTADAKALARKLTGCSKDNRCGSEACPICMRKFRIGLLREGLMVIEERRYWYACSIIPAGLSRPIGDLASFDLKKYREAVKKRLERSEELNGVVVIGGVDISLNTEDNNNPTWQPHLYLLVAGLPKKVLKAAITRAFEGEITARRPQRLRRVYGPRGALSYAYKARFWRRSGYQPPKGRKNTRFQALKPPELHELSLFLSMYRVGDRLILRGVRRDGSRFRILVCRRDRKARTRKT
jgi:hypothetical protein